jgi:hypothetical protein
VDRAEAEAIYDAGQEVIIEVLLRMDRRIQQLDARVEISTKTEEDQT